MVDGGEQPLSEEPQLVEEEFDLADILGEELEEEVGSKEDRLRQLAEQVLACLGRDAFGLSQGLPSATPHSIV